MQWLRLDAPPLFFEDENENEDEDEDDSLPQQPPDFVRDGEFFIGRHDQAGG